jgi:hypothetical protein
MSRWPNDSQILGTYRLALIALLSAFSSRESHVSLSSRRNLLKLTPSPYNMNFTWVKKLTPFGDTESSTIQRR